LTDSEVTDETIQQAVNQVINTSIPFFKNESEALSPTQMNLLLAVARGENNFSSKNTIEKYLLGTPSNVTKNKKILQHKDILDKSGDSLHFLDPVFRKWLLREYATNHNNM